jgi:signal transduction histidine kinase
MARIIAHEIKNPLTPIRLSTEFLREVWQRDRERFPEALERCTANILRQVDELRDIAGDFATYSRLPRLERAPGDLAALAREIVAGYSTASSASPAVVLEAPASVPCRFDGRLLGRAIRNLIENALRASAAGQRVEVSVGFDEDGARIVVADRGPGVPEAQLSRIFEPYFSTHAGGTGLGLPIARRIAVEHGGTLVANHRPGGGLAAVITIPT